MRRRPSAALSASVLVLTLASACATYQPPPSMAIPATSADLQTLAKRERVLTSLQTSAVMEYSGPNGHVKARERIMIRRPANLRVEVLSPLGIELIVAADAHEVAVFDPSKNTVTRGAATAETLDRVARIPLTPHQATRLLLALAPDASILVRQPESTSEVNGETTLLFSLDDTGTAQLAFGNGDLEMVRDESANGTMKYEVRYSDYRDIGGLTFPHTIEAHFPLSGTTVKFRFDSPLIDQTIPDSSFVLDPGPQTRELRLGLNAERLTAID